MNVDEKQLSDLISAVWQALDDFGKDGKTVCAATKAGLRVAFEPFRESAGFDDMDYPLDEAKALLDKL